MEPVLGGRDDAVKILTPAQIADAWPQWSPSLADGTTSITPKNSPHQSSRNGARPWRTGRLSAASPSESDM